MEHLVIIGGGAGGATAAAKARRTKPAIKITMIEAGKYISYAACGLPYYIGGEIKEISKIILRSPRDFKDLYNINVLIEHKVEEVYPAKKQLLIRDLIKEETFNISYDKLIIATGSILATPGIEGVNLKNIFSLRSVSDAQNILKVITETKPKKAVIIGGGVIAMEMVESFTKRGVEVTVIEREPQILLNFDPEIANQVKIYLERQGVKVLTGCSVKEFRGNSVNEVEAVITDEGELEAQLVLLATGIRPNVKLAERAGIFLGTTGAIKVNERMETNIKDIYAAGDCVESTHIITGSSTWAPLGSVANKQGRVAGENVAGGKAIFRGVLNSMIAKVFNFTVARTGLSEKEALQLGYNIVSGLVVASDKSHYYPDRKDITIKLIGERKTNRLLGAQIVGEGVVDKRIDVVVAALTKGMTVEEFINLDLCYAPPYAMAIDAVLVAGNVLLSQIYEDLGVITPVELKYRLERGENLLLVDVRTDKERRRSRLPDQYFIPHYELEKRYNELPKDKELILYCYQGKRSLQGLKTLKRLGFKQVKSLEGGLKLWPYEVIQ